jgi:hypothetical protein
LAAESTERSRAAWVLLALAIQVQRLLSALLPIVFGGHLPAPGDGLFTAVVILDGLQQPAIE